MIDVADLKQRTDLLSLVGQDTTLRKHAGTRGGEYVGPCPFCHSGHRIHVQPATGLWFCRFCCPDGKWHDAKDRDNRRQLYTCERCGKEFQAPNGARYTVRYCSWGCRYPRKRS